jgi:disulfide bond formation protein DsbB
VSAAGCATAGERLVVIGATHGAASANRLLIVVPAVLLLGALGFQHLGGLAPCEMCLWQRWPHLAALVLAGSALVAGPGTQRALLIIAAGAVLTSGAIGVFHVGVEQHWWLGPQHCTPTVTRGRDFLNAVLAAPIVRCDVAAWSLGGVSMAGWNAVISIVTGLGAFALLGRAK